MHQNQQLTQYDRAPSAFFFIIDSYKSISSTAGSLFDLIRWNQTKISSAPPSIIDFIQINFFNSWLSFFDLIRWNQTKISSAFLFIIDFIQINYFNNWFFRNQTKISSAFISIIDSYRSNLNLFQLKWFFENNVIWRFFDDFHIEKYFHLFFFMGWILILFNSFYWWDE